LRRFEKIGVVGAGMMGSEIALMFALAGHPTILSDQERAAADRALDRLHGLAERDVGRGFWSAEAAESARRNLKRR
jgi:3-hydroxybutyryl-CoA dehydrogenase